jgi:hypothetical protein
LVITFERRGRYGGLPIIGICEQSGRPQSSSVTAAPAVPLVTRGQEEYQRHPGESRPWVTRDRAEELHAGGPAFPVPLPLAGSVCASVRPRPALLWSVVVVSLGPTSPRETPQSSQSRRRPSSMSARIFASPPSRSTRCSSLASKSWVLALSASRSSPAISRRAARAETVIARSSKACRFRSLMAVIPGSASRSARGVAPIRGLVGSARAVISPSAELHMRLVVGLPHPSLARRQLAPRLPALLVGQLCHQPTVSVVPRRWIAVRKRISAPLA